MTGRPGLVAHPYGVGRPQFLYQLPDRLRSIGDLADGLDLTARLRDRHRNRVCMDIQANEPNVANFAA